MNNAIKKRLTNNIVSNRIKHILNVIDLDKANTILDIGSWHLGQAIEFSNIFPNAQIYAFEPVPESFNNCLRTSKNFSNITVHNIALSDVSGAVSFFEVDSEKSSKPNIGASSLLKFKEGLNGTFFNEIWIQKEIKVQAETLDDWCEKNTIKKIDVIWIDVQGAELNVFKGGSKILKETKVILTEVGIKPYYEKHTLKTDIDNFLQELNFKEETAAFELNGFDYEANAIYLNKKFL